MRVRTFTPKPETLSFNKRFGRNICLLREIRQLPQKALYEPLGYTSGGWSMIEAGKRGLNKTKIKQAAKILNTYPEVLVSDTELTKEEMIDLDRFIRIRRDPQHPFYGALLKLIQP